MVHFHPLCYAHFDPLRVVHFNPPQVVYYVRFLQRARAYDIYQELKYRDELITAQLIKAKFNGEDENSKRLQEILDYHNKKNEKTLASGTIRNFGITANIP